MNKTTQPKQSRKSKKCKHDWQHVSTLGGVLILVCRKCGAIQTPIYDPTIDTFSTLNDKNYYTEIDNDDYMSD